jgi:hypothetical protein
MRTLDTLFLPSLPTMPFPQLTWTADYRIIEPDLLGRRNAKREDHLVSLVKVVKARGCAYSICYVVTTGVRGCASRLSQGTGNWCICCNDEILIRAFNSLWLSVREIARLGSMGGLTFK